MEHTAADPGGNGEAVLDTSANPQSPQKLDIPQPLEVDQNQLQEEVAEAAPQEATIAEDPSPPKASLSSKVCGVCNDQQAKYKCSRCEIPYCSVACATLHRAVPCEAPVARSLTPPAAEPATQNGSTRPLPGTVAGSSQGNIFSVLESSQKLQALFIMYPRLRAQLRDVYNATLPPTEDSNQENPYPQFQRGRGGGRGGMGRGGRQGPWNSDRGTQNGIDALGKAKVEFGKDGEGVREYANLVLKLVAADGVDVARLVQDEVAEENAKIIAQLLNGDAY